MALTDAADRAAQGLDRVTVTLATLRAQADQSLAEAIRRGQMPQTLEALRRKE